MQQWEGKIGEGTLNGTTIAMSYELQLIFTMKVQNSTHDILYYREVLFLHHFSSLNVVVDLFQAVPECPRGGH